MVAEEQMDMVLHRVVMEGTVSALQEHMVQGVVTVIEA